jgi:hypothetical protein
MRPQKDASHTLLRRCPIGEILPAEVLGHLRPCVAEKSVKFRLRFLLDLVTAVRVYFVRRTRDKSDSQSMVRSGFGDTQA